MVWTCVVPMRDYSWVSGELDWGSSHHLERLTTCSLACFGLTPQHKHSEQDSWRKTLTVASFSPTSHTLIHVNGFLFYQLDQGRSKMHAKIVIKVEKHCHAPVAISSINHYCLLCKLCRTCSGMFVSHCSTLVELWLELPMYSMSGLDLLTS